MPKPNKRIKELREKFNISQKKLAEELNVSQVAVNHWENGKRDISMIMIEKIADYFNVSPSYLMGWDDEPTTLAAHFDGDEYTEEELEEIKKFAEFVKSQRK